MYNFIRNQWVLGKYDATNIANCVTKGFITQAQADEIMALPQNPA
jgi:hypothetical protein